jgi:trehalose/maltose hydrolase-like predicted phosphorylase
LPIPASYDPATGRHEQFAGFSDLEPVVVYDLLARPVAADTVLGRERVEASQILKQADVLMLHLLVPEEVAPGSLGPDLDYYEPRTAHGSSLSPGVHAALLARAGRLDDAVAALAMTARLDLDESLVSAAHGMHSATMGGLWQALVVGFGGIRPSGDALLVDPRMPGAWGEVRIPVRFRGSRVRVRVAEDRLDVRARPAALIAVGSGAPAMIGPAGRRFRRAAGCWEPA